MKRKSPWRRIFGPHPFPKVSRLDVKLGLRMFAKYPGLSLVAVAGMAVAIALGAGYFALVSSFVDTSVPIEDGDRVVMIRNRYVSGPDAARTGKTGDHRGRDEKRSTAGS